MSLNIKDEETSRLAREVARLAGETITEAVKRSLAERAVKLKAQRHDATLVYDIMEIGRRCASLPVLDTRSSAEILGYDKDGLPS
ncbi:MAG: type II toxin-antitoxin system VapB family antitoxin [Alphaproteobacteria bacterium]|nr:type II toxin-antitoxin system VapB family antitoxin [Alphaproteobacteria bacterium]